MAYNYDYSDYQVTITGGGLRGILQDGTLSIPFGMSASTSEGAKMSDTSHLGTSIAKGITNKLFGEGNIVSQSLDAYKSSVHSVKEFIKTYENSSDLSLSLSIIIIPGKFGNPGSYAPIISAISKMTLPKVEGNKMYSQLVSDPSPVFENWKALDGQLCGIHIGSWFHTQEVFWCTSASTSFSTVIDTQGRPSYLTVSLSFDPYRPLTSGDVNGWIG